MILLPLFIIKYINKKIIKYVENKNTKESIKKECKKSRIIFLPNEILLEIIKYLNITQLNETRFLCKKWYYIISDILKRNTLICCWTVYEEINKLNYTKIYSDSIKYEKSIYTHFISNYKYLTIQNKKYDVLYKFYKPRYNSKIKEEDIDNIIYNIILPYNVNIILLLDFNELMIKKICKCNNIDVIIIDDEKRYKYLKKYNKIVHIQTRSFVS